MNGLDDEKIQNLARQALEDDLQRLDVGLVSQLRASRQSALAALGARARLQPMLGWAMAASVFLALNVWWWQAPTDVNLSAEDFEMIVSDEYIELHEDLDFYTWVGVESDAG